MLKREDDQLIMEEVPCNVCGKKDLTPLGKKYDLPVVQCRNCGLVFSNPRIPPRQSWERYSQAYFDNEYLPFFEQSIGGKFTEEANFQLHKGYLAPCAAYRQNNRLLDVGCGVGLLLAAARHEGWEPYGVEVSPYGVQYAKEKLGLEHVFNTTLEEQRFPDNYFDMIMMVEVIEHLYHPLEVLAECYRILRPGGSISLTTPNYQGLSRRRLGLQWHLMSPAEHLYLFSEGNLRQLLHQAGFPSIWIQTAGGAPVPVPAWLPATVKAPGEHWVTARKDRLDTLLNSSYMGDALMAWSVKGQPVLPFPSSPTPWWLLPLRVQEKLSTGGINGVLQETKDYIRWRQRK